MNESQKRVHSIKATFSLWAIPNPPFLSLSLSLILLECKVLKENSTEFWFQTQQKKEKKNQSEHNTFYDPNFIETNPKSQTFQVHFGKNWKMGDYTISYEKGFICKVLQTGDITNQFCQKSGRNEK